jgi:hypothetical protein
MVTRAVVATMLLSSAEGGPELGTLGDRQATDQN